MATTLRLVDESMPNVWAFSFTAKTGLKITLFKSTPGDTAPRMQMHRIAPTVEEPERFGPYSTKREFRAWCEEFVRQGSLDD